METTSTEATAVPSTTTSTTPEPELAVAFDTPYLSDTAKEHMEFIQVCLSTGVRYGGQNVEGQNVLVTKRLRGKTSDGTQKVLNKKRFLLIPFASFAFCHIRRFVALDVLPVDVLSTYHLYPL